MSPYSPCSLAAPPAPATAPTNDCAQPKNEVLILGTIHSGHLTDSVYNNAYVERLIRRIKPDYILAEIPPDRLAAAWEGFRRDDSISEPRIIRFPEYKDVVFPLSKEMNFEIIPTAGWTKPMADERTQKTPRHQQRPDKEKGTGPPTSPPTRRQTPPMKQRVKSIIPHFIHTHAYDSIQDISLQVYNRLFNVELGLGGWENINIAHYWHIEKALEQHRYEGKRFLIIYGAGHKRWQLRELRKRDDIELLEMADFLE